MSGYPITTAGRSSGKARRAHAVVLIGGLLLLALGVPTPVRAATFEVTNTSDSGAGSLRAAITAANGTAAADTITFNIPGAGVKTIAPTTALPDITAPVTIDGYSQSGASANTLAVGNNAVLRIELSGASAPQGTDGLRVNTDDSVIKGLVINGWKQATGIASAAVRILAGADRNVIRGNFIGTNASGTAAVANADGISIVDAADNVIGGATPAARNTVSGNLSGGVGMVGDRSIGNQVLGNYVGTNAAGLAAVANGNGVGVNAGADENVVGGTTAAARNIISGNTFVGVDVSPPHEQGGEDTDRNIVSGNYIGLNARGDAAIGNQIGVLLSGFGDADDNVIGGSTPGSGNTISGNLQYGILVDAVQGANVIEGNLVGTMPAGDTPLGNGSHGILLEDGSGFTVGGTVAGSRNVISGNGGDGLRIDGAFLNTLLGNYVGTDLSGTAPLPNAGYGVSIAGFSAGNVVGTTSAGAGNRIAYNAGDGIAVTDREGASPIINQFSGNSIHSNGGLGIDLGSDGVTPNDPGDEDEGPNALQNFPVLASAVLLSNGSTRFRVQLDVEPDDTYRVEFFSNTEADPTGFGEGQTYLGSADIVVGASGQANQLVTLPVAVPVGTPVTATDTPFATGNTSELSEAIEVVPALRIDDVSAAEGDTGTTDRTFTARLAAAAEETVTVDYSTTNSTATAPSDYTARSGSLTFPTGDTSETVTVQVKGDTAVEPDERFFLDLSNFSLGSDAIEDGRGRGTITNDDTDGGGEPPSFSIDDVTEAEGDSGTIDFNVTVTRSGDTSGSSSVHYQTTNGTASAPSDYTAIPDTTLNFSAGQTSRTITVEVNGDTGVEADETFFVDLSQATGADISDSRGRGTISNDDEDDPGGEPPVLDIDDVTGMEGDEGRTDFVFMVMRSGDTSGSSSVHYRTKEGTATVPQDFVPIDDAVLDFAPGQAEATITVEVKGDGRRAPDETFRVILSDPVRATIGDGRATGTILYDDPFLLIRDVTISEPASGTATARFKVVLSYPTISGVTVHYRTRDGTAVAGRDYAAKSDAVLTFPAGEWRRHAKVKINADRRTEPRERFFVELFDATGPDGATRIEDPTGKGVILD